MKRSTGEKYYFELFEFSLSHFVSFLACHSVVPEKA